MMQLMEWNDNLSVDIAEIDQQHQKLIAYINDLNAAMLEGKGKEVLGTILDGLTNYTVSHFSVEEKYFDQFQYNGTAAHKLEHQNFVQKVSEFKQGFDEDRLMLSMEIMAFLKDWITNHIMGSDKKYTQCFKDNGLQ